MVRLPPGSWVIAFTPLPGPDRRFFPVIWTRNRAGRSDTFRDGFRSSDLPANLLVVFPVIDVLTTVVLVIGLSSNSFAKAT